MSWSDGGWVNWSDGGDGGLTGGGCSNSIDDSIDDVTVRWNGGLIDEIDGRTGCWSGVCWSDGCLHDLP